MSGSVVLRCAYRIAAGLLAVSACGMQTPPTSPQAFAADIASVVQVALPAGRPGYGVTDYPGNAEGDVPKAYAMVLLADLERRPEPGGTGGLQRARTAGQWLLEHSDTNRDGTVGWGLPVAWDAYEDGSTNPAHTEYTISTAIAIDALLSWAERDAQAPRDRIREVVHAAILPYLDARNASPSGMAPYSLARADRPYDTFNPAAFLAGQIQRAGLALIDPAQRQRYAAAADATMRVLLAHRRTTPGQGHWYWNYSIQQEVPNDLPHAGYVIAGIRTYIEHGGRLADRFDWHAILAHLGDFRGPGGDVRAFPHHVHQVPALALQARTYDIGFALHLACTEPAVEPLVPWLLGSLDAYRGPAGRFLKYPREDPPSKEPARTELVVNEYEAYLYRGLAGCAAQPRRSPKVARSPAVALKTPGGDATRLAQSLVAEPARAADLVPLLPPEAGFVSFDAQHRARIHLEGVGPLALAWPGVPVRVLAREARTWIFHRQHPDDRLWLLQFDQGRLTCRQALDHGDDATARPSLRAATLHGDRLHVIYHHNATSANWHVALDIGHASGGCPTRGDVSPLPSVEDPAGPTYEMIPPLRFHDAGPRSGLVLVGGNFEVDIGGSGPGEVRRIPGCHSVLETVNTPRGLAHLCVPVQPAGSDSPRLPFIAAPAGVDLPRIDPSQGVPWRLQWSLGALQIDHARTPRQLRHLLRRDLASTAPGGWMEFGINNEEGRIPWSQIYYLNGLLDILDLARRDEGLLELYGPLLPEVRRRLDMEMRWLDTHVAEGRHRTRAFTVDRSRALFGVQTGRFLLVMHRYLKEVPGAAPLASYAGLKRAVQRLEGHIEVLATEGEDAKWIRPGLHHLRWPKGSKFYFDGMPVPFNHQNEWAYAVLATADESTPPESVQAATDILRHFTDRIAPAGTLPASGGWDYWWGRAHEGWDEPGRYSMNVPRYGGDKIKAWISFRTIDAMSLVAGAARLGPQEAANARASSMALAARGLLYPLANHAWVNEASAIHLGAPTAIEYARVSSPWELGNAAWSLAALARRWRGD